MRIARIFPTKTKASPNDELAFFGPPPLLNLPEIDEVHISVTFQWDKERAEILAYQWDQLGVSVKMGGPAFNQPGGEFVPGMYLKRGYTITSRGCPNHCWFCAVPKRERGLRELSISEGWIVQDDNLLACSESHILAVFNMLSKQPHRPIFSGGIESKLLKPWHVELFQKVKAREIFCAYDTPDDYEPLVAAGRMLHGAGFTFENRKARCYVLIGYPGDTMDNAERRLFNTVYAGFMPFAMLYRDEAGKYNTKWRRFQREWVRPAIIAKNVKQLY